MNFSRATTPEQRDLTAVRINPKIGDNKWFSGQVTIHGSLDEISPDQWNALVPEDTPILKHSCKKKGGTFCLLPPISETPQAVGFYLIAKDSQGYSVLHYYAEMHPF